MKRTSLVAAIALLAATPLFAQTPWVHVAVDEPADEAGGNATKVNVNLPLSVVRIALQAAPDHVISEGKIHLRHVDEDIDIASVRAIWAELKSAGDAEFVSVEEDDQSVRVRREGDTILIDIDERDNIDGDEPKQVRVEVPVRVVDALFSGDGETLNIEQALDELRTERGDIVHVDDGDTKVRIWIDEKD